MRFESLVPKSVFGMDLSLQDDEIEASIPIALLDGLAVKRAHLGSPANIDFHAIISPKRLAMKPVRAIVRSIATLSGLPCVVCSPVLSRDQMDALARESIPYIQDADNMFLPFIGAKATTLWLTAEPKVLSLPAQRLLVNYLAGRWVGCSAGEIAKRLGKSNASVTKYLSEIEAVCPPLVLKVGKSRVLGQHKMYKADLLGLFEPYLKTQVRRIHRLARPLDFGILRETGFALAGDSALSFATDLAFDPSCVVVAIDARGLKTAREVFGEAWAEAPWYAESPMVVQEWAYPIDATDDISTSATGLPCVDPESLYVSYLGAAAGDIRLQDAIDQLRGKICR